MADTKISGLPAVSTTNGNQELPVNDEGVSKKLTVKQMRDFTNNLILVADNGSDPVEVGSTSDQTIFIDTVYGLVAGDQLEVDGYFGIRGNGSAPRSYVITLDFNETFDIELTTPTHSPSPSSYMPFHLKALLSVKSILLTYLYVSLEAYTGVGLTSGEDTFLSTGLYRGVGWGSSSTNFEGNSGVSLRVRCSATEMGHDLYLDHFSIRKYNYYTFYA